MIVVAAVKHCGKVFTGARHHLAIRAAVAQTGVRPVKGGEHQGFLDEAGNWHDRTNAATHALACGQINALKFNPRELFSEDVW
jgi:urease beta subunit